MQPAAYMFVRGAGYQYVTGKLRPECLKVVDGKLIQFPFDSRCLREIDWNGMEEEAKIQWISYIYY